METEPEEEPVLCDECGDRYGLMACEDCISLYCMACGLRCDCDQHPVRIDITATVDKLPADFLELMISEGIYELSYPDNRRTFIIECGSDMDHHN